MNLYYNILAITILIGLTSCKRQSSVAKFNLIPFIKKQVDVLKQDSKGIVKVQLCDQLPFEWDSIFIMEPYTSADKLRKAGYDNSSYLESKLPALALNESNSILLFINKKHIQKYTIVPRSFIDFTTITRNEISVYKVSKKDACENLLLKQTSQGVISLELN